MQFRFVLFSVVKVCQVCFEKDKLSDGQTRSHTQDLIYLRRRFKEKTLPTYNSGNPSTWRDKVNFDRECDRCVFPSGLSYRVTEFSALR